MLLFSGGIKLVGYGILAFWWVWSSANSWWLWMNYYECLQYYRAMNGYLFGPRIVLDMGFIKDLNAEGQAQTGKQLRECWATNKEHSMPAHLYFTECDENSSTWIEYRRRFLHRINQFVDITPKSYLDFKYFFEFSPKFRICFEPLKPFFGLIANPF